MAELTIDVRDLKALERYATEMRSSSLLAKLAVGKSMSHDAQRLEGVNLEFKEARHFATNAKIQSDALEQFVTHVASSINAYADFALGSLANYLEADLKSEAKLAEVEEIIRTKVLAGESEAHNYTKDKPYEDYGWNEKEINDVLEAHLLGRRAGTPELDYYDTEQLQHASPTAGTTDWEDRGDYGKTFLRVYDRERPATGPVRPGGQRSAPDPVRRQRVGQVDVPAGLRPRHRRAIHPEAGPDRRGRLPALAVGQPAGEPPARLRHLQRDHQPVAVGRRGGDERAAARAGRYRRAASQP